MRAVAMLIFMGIFMALWSTVYAVSGNTTESGYTLRDIVWYLVMTETVMMSSSRIFVDMGEAVRSGAVATTLARPVSFPLSQMATSLGTSAPRFALNLAAGMLVVSLGVGFGAGSLPGLAAFLLLAALALLLDALIVVLIGLLAFWMEETQPVFWIYQKLLFTVGGLFLPLEFFPDWL
ncbi:MAG: ABC-2 family transporter protein, partial [Anaerolineae bacterium]|nr:ABC-2 family transporter protein [Anaerolineae bacterium]